VSVRVARSRELVAAGRRPAVVARVARVSRQAIYRVFTIRDEQIIDWQDCRTWRASRRALRSNRSLTLSAWSERATLPL